MIQTRRPFFGIRLFLPQITGSWSATTRGIDMDETVQVTRDGGVLKIVLNRPKANAIDLPTSQKLGEAFVAPLGDDLLGR